MWHTDRYTYNSTDNGLNKRRYFSDGVTTVTITATDAKGNVETCIFTVTIKNTCDQVTSPGIIQGDQTFCAGSALTPITEVAPATGGSGDLEYMWMYSTTSSVFDAASWTAIDGETGPNLNSVPALNSTAYFIRCVRRKGCVLFTESNVVIKKIGASASYKGPFIACLNTDVEFTADDNGSNASYTWYFEGANVSSARGRTVKVKFTSLGGKKITLEVFNNGCNSRLVSDLDVRNCLTNNTGVLSGFSATVMNQNDVMVAWTTTQEQTISKYLIERSFDGKEFDVIGSVASNLKPANNYIFHDTKPKRGRSFYRLRQMVDEKEVRMSEVKKTIIFVKGNESALVYPNPVGDQLFVELLEVENTEGSIEVYNTFGQLIKTERFGKDQSRYEVNTSDMPTGTYILRILPASGTSSAIKVFKN
ncbi:MAG: T9SS type A sorting domain-containing protein [Saprospiraceae bacterium]|nr:T9SS type A sorting domain-containing protein [Saprospiraceae bacterium]